MKTERFTFVGFGGTTLHAVIWLPEEEPQCLLQITHGMTEHMGRYESFAREMTDQGILVAGFDLRGHGLNPGQGGIAALEEGEWEATLQDMKLFFSLLQSRFPEKKHYIYGLSLGSFLVREYLGRFSQGIAGAILMGTGNQPDWLLRLMLTLVRSQLRKVGWQGTSSLIQQLSFGSYNQKFKPNRTHADWLCGDEGELDQYLRDPLCRPKISAGLFCQMLEAMRRTGRGTACACWEKNTPILLLGGEEDPVGNMGKGMRAVERQLRNAGIKNVTLHLMPHARHLLLCERRSGAQAEVCRIMTDFLLL